MLQDSLVFSFLSGTNNRAQNIVAAVFLAPKDSDDTFHGEDFALHSSLPLFSLEQD